MGKLAVRFQPKQFKGKKACVIGLGKSGQAVAKLLAKKGFKVFGSDTRPKKELKAALKRLPSSVSWEGGGHSDRVLKCAFAVKSPGLPPHLPVFNKFRGAGIPIFSELEIALTFSKCREIIAITGTNGKTTTTAMVADIFRKGLPRGRKALVCGNIGIPISEMAPKAGAKDVLVMEASSYQLEDSRHFHPQAAAILNITADHIDHHGTMNRYIEAKAKIFREQSSSDACVFNADDPILMKLARRCPGRRLYFGTKGHGPVNSWADKGKITVKLPGSKKDITLTPPALPGRHNLENAMAAALLSLSRGIKPAAIQAAFKAFKGVEHRIEEAGVHHGLRCVNDSKATNVDSTMVALKAFAEAAGGRAPNILLILGGLHKGLPYTPLKTWIEKTVKGILTIGAAARKVEEDLSGVIPIFPCGDLKTAVETAFKIGSKGDVLLLSPACASFDQFKDFEDRGRQFKELVGGKRA
jgi:UDP-N-acetylmuramoylalanine--D-glutamate ligase